MTSRIVASFWMISTAKLQAHNAHGAQLLLSFTQRLFPSLWPKITPNSSLNSWGFWWMVMIPDYYTAAFPLPSISYWAIAKSHHDLIKLGEKLQSVVNLFLKLPVSSYEIRAFSSVEICLALCLGWKQKKYKILLKHKLYLLSGSGQCPRPPLHPGPEDTPAMFGVCRSEDLPE